ncbi:MAG: (d)CMP kinase [bacterium]
MDEFRLNLSKLRGKIVAIDGPAGAGKSTTSKILARKLGYLYLDTGAMYRALTWFVLENGIDPSDGDRLTALANKVPIEFKSDPDREQRVLINGVDVTQQIRTPQVTQHVSEVAAHPGVRRAMVSMQRRLGANGSIVAEGRDTTTVVFPKADIKIYLDATVRTRAQRRLLDLARMGISTTLEEQVADIERRDAYDSGREHSPLTQARDAYVVNTTNLNIEEQIDHIIALMRSVFK